MPSQRYAHRRQLAAVVCLGALLAACTGSSDDPVADRSSSPAVPSPAFSSPIGPSGTIKFGVLGEPATLDPYSPMASDLTYALARPVYPSLFRLLPDGTSEPYLAEGIESMPGGVRVSIRPAQWSDGSLITSEDVVASARRARLPSGFALADSVSAAGSTAVEFRGPGVDWKQALAAGAFVLPRGRVGPKAGGPFRVRSRTPGLEVVLAPNRRWVGGSVGLERVRVQFIQNLSTMTYLLRKGRLDAAALPSAVNLGFRLEEAGLQYDSALGWESVAFDFSAGDLSMAGRRALAAIVRRDALQAGFVRDDGRVSDTLAPSPGAGGADGPWTKPSMSPARLRDRTIGLGAPVGDELLNSMQHVIQLQLGGHDVRADLLDVDVRTFYGSWARRGPADGYLVRSFGAPGLPEPRADGLAAMPLFHVATYLAWSEGVRGPAVNPSIEGPLWNLESWIAGANEPGS